MLRMPLTSIVLVLTSLTLAETSIATSTEKLRDIASDVNGEVIQRAIDQRLSGIVTSLDIFRDLASDKDDVIWDAVQEDIDTALTKLKSLTQLLENHFKTQAPGMDTFNLNHPNDIYLLIKGVVFAYSDLTAQLTGKSDSDILTSISNSGDLMVARSSLLRLQTVYGLKARDMYRGDYRGHLGKALGAQDCVWLGREAFHQGFPKEAIGWLELAVEEMDSASKPLPQDETYIKHLIQHLQALGLLGRLYLKNNQTGMAEKVLTQCKSSKGVEMSRLREVTALENELDEANARAAFAGYEGSFREPDAEPDVNVNVSALCSRPQHQRVEALRPFHACRLKPDVHVPYLLYKEEILSLKPYVSLFYDVIYDKEIQALKEIGKQRLEPREVANGDTSSQVPTSQSAWLGDEYSGVRVVSERTQAMTRLEVLGRKGCPLSAEDLQVVNYGLGGHIAAHIDAKPTEEIPINMDPSGNKLATFLLYLTNVEDGGSTVFTRIGISVTPIKGMALLFYNFEPAAEQPNDMTTHAGCPVVIGNKWIANKWIRMYGNTFRRPCGLTPDTQQLEVETLVANKIPFMNIEPCIFV